jgi:hypothetical protein
MNFLEGTSNSHHVQLVVFKEKNGFVRDPHGGFPIPSGRRALCARKGNEER